MAQKSNDFSPLKAWFDVIDSIPDRPKDQNLVIQGATIPAQMVVRMLKDTARSFLHLSAQTNMAMQGQDPGLVNPLDVMSVLTLGSPGAAVRGNSVGVFGGRLPRRTYVEGPGREVMATPVAVSGRGHILHEISDDRAYLRRSPDDRTMVFDNNPEHTMSVPQKLSDILEHKELFDAYPELRDVRVEYDPAFKQSGAFGKGTDGQYVMTIGPAALKSPEETLKTVIHEAQHGTQFIDNDTAFARDPMVRQNPRATGSSEPIAAMEQVYLAQRFESFMKKGAADLLSPVERDALEKLCKVDPKILYYTNPGEIEARVAEDRLRMTPFERAQSGADLTHDPMTGMPEMDLQRLSTPLDRQVRPLPKALPGPPERPAFGKRKEAPAVQPEPPKLPDLKA